MTEIIMVDTMEEAVGMMSRNFPEFADSVRDSSGMVAGLFSDGGFRCWGYAVFIRGKIIKGGAVKIPLTAPSQDMEIFHLTAKRMEQTMREMNNVAGAIVECLIDFSPNSEGKCDCPACRQARGDDDVALGS